MRRRRVLTGLGILVLVAAASSGITLGLSGNSTATQHLAVGPSNGTGVSTGNLNVSAIASKVDPSLVDITSVLGYQGGESAGTGMVLSSSGIVVTNNHVIDGATSISATIAGTSHTYKVKILGADPTKDVALLQLEGASGLPTVTLADSSSATVGESVVAIGNALDLPGPPTVTQGAITALGRSITAGDPTAGTSEQLSGVIQIDAPLQPGNSGGPLLDSRGQVIGMNTAAAANTSGYAPNVGFAIPSNNVSAIVNQIEAGRGSSTVQIGNQGTTRGFLGIGVVNASQAVSNPAGPLGGFGSPFGFGGGSAYTPPTTSGALIVTVLQNTPAAQAGLAPGDVIVSLNGTPVSTAKGLTKALTPFRPGSTVTVGWVDATGQSQSASITLTTGPAD